jgi:hypothetical protein
MCISIVLVAAGALWIVELIAKVVIRATTADLINLDLNTDFPRIQINEVGLYPISRCELMPLVGASQLSSGKKRVFLKSYAIETFTRGGEVRLPRLGWNAKSPG